MQQRVRRRGQEQVLLQELRRARVHVQRLVQRLVQRRVRVRRRGAKQEVFGARSS